MDYELDSELVKYKIAEDPEGYQKQLNWDMAIGLQLVDGLTPSKYLIELAKENIEGKRNSNEIENLLNTYYKTRDLNDKSISDEQECDLVSSRIVALLNRQGFSLNSVELKETHHFLFQKIYNFAGKYRDYNITKNEYILNGNSVTYGDFRLIERMLFLQKNISNIFLKTY